MGNVLLLVHRLPYPPNKGDKVRSYHLLKHLVRQHRVFLGTFVDDPVDEQHIPTVRSICPDLQVERLNPLASKVRSLAALLTGQALGLHYYRNTALQAWVNRTLQNNAIDAVVIFSSVMAQYVEWHADAKAPTLLVDFVDVDSAKWTDYAPQHRWPLSWLYRREGERLLAFERALAASARRSFFVTDNETALFKCLAPECANQVEALSNGVDSEFFSPDPACQSPFADGSVPIVFTGAMDYWPNIDAVQWFTSDILPQLLARWPQLHFYIVGRSPTPAVQALASEVVTVTGTVPDVRPYLQRAALVVAPLRVARGIQNKILEAMAMARPVIASLSCVEAIDALDGTELISATTADTFADHIHTLLQSPERAHAIGQAGRQCVTKHYSWDAHLAGIDRHLHPFKAS